MFEGSLLINSKLLDEFPISNPKIKAKLLPARTVGVQGDGRSYSSLVGLFGPADWDCLFEAARDIPKSIHQVNRVVYVAQGDVDVFQYTITETKLRDEEIGQLQQADGIVNRILFDNNLVKKLSQVPVILFPADFGQTGKRSIAVRPFITNDFMTGKAARPGRDFDESVWNQMVDEILRDVPNIAQVVLDLTSKPPGTVSFDGSLVYNIDRMGVVEIKGFSLVSIRLYHFKLAMTAADTWKVEPFPVEGTSTEEVIGIICRNAGHRLQIVRTQFADELVQFFSTSDKPTRETIEHCLWTLTDHKSWECRQSAFILLPKLLRLTTTPSFASSLVGKALDKVNDQETRVRIAIGECLYSCVSVADDPTDHWDRVLDAILPLIQAHWDRQGDGEAQHDTEGWKSLETSFAVLEKVLGGCRGLVKVPELLVLLIFQSVSHLNRFVRETSFFIVGTICRTSSEDDLIGHISVLVDILSKGLSDNWSQVRFAASVATRSLLSKEGIVTSPHFYVLIPPMCLNRYYIAEGVRLYSVESWKMMTKVMGLSGASVVEKHIEKVVHFYISQAEADNHAVREAVCYCIAELGTKITVDFVRPFVVPLLDSLIDAFKDQSWPVRDAAATALGDFVKGFPEECRGTMGELYQMWVAHLSDNINSVREDSAVALGKVMDAYGEESVEYLFEVLTELLPKALEQKEDSKRFQGLKSTTRFGVADPMHEDQQMYSCGSLAPKLKRGGGCMDHGFARTKEPWESSDGAVYLLREMAQRDGDKVLACFDMVSSISSLSHFSHHVYLKETIWKQMPLIFEGIGRERSMTALDSIIDPLFKCLSCGHRLAENAADSCIRFMEQFLGRSEMEARMTVCFQC